jgi:hypothetical protein
MMVTTYIFEKKALFFLSQLKAPPCMDNSFVGPPLIFGLMPQGYHPQDYDPQIMGGLGEWAFPYSKELVELKKNVYEGCRILTNVSSGIEEASYASKSLWGRFLFSFPNKILPDPYAGQES